MDSREIAEWEAYERSEGPLGLHYVHEMLAKINDSMTLANYMYGLQFEENPIPDPEPTTRPNELYKVTFLEPEEDDEDEDFTPVEVDNSPPEEDEEETLTEAQFSALFD